MKEGISGIEDIIGKRIDTLVKKNVKSLKILAQNRLRNLKLYEKTKPTK